MSDKASKKDFDARSSDASSIEEIFEARVLEEQGRSIQYRTCSWQKTAALIFSEYICLAIMSFPWSYSILGLVPGILVTIAVAATVQYTSLILWRYCLKYPELQNVCDLGQKLFTPNSDLSKPNWVYTATAIMFILNNTFIQALHCLVGAKLLNTLSNGALCTVAFSAITAIICYTSSLPRTLASMSSLGTFSAVTMFIAVILAIAFSGVQDHPFGFEPGSPPEVYLFTPKGTTYVQAMSAFLNITYTFVGQITLPSFIAEMRDPKDFPKALWAVTVSEIIVFTLCGAIMYHFVGTQYMTAPAFGSLQPVFKKVAFSFAIPTIIFLGALYCSVSARFIFFRIFSNSHHRYSNTFTGWATWCAIIAILWVAAFVIAEVIPFFSDMLSLMSSLFDGWFGFIFWGVAYFRMRGGPRTLGLHGTVKQTPKDEKRWNADRPTVRLFEDAVNYFLIALGAYILIAGTYVSVQSIINDYRAGNVGSAFSCTNNGL